MVFLKYNKKKLYKKKINKIWIIVIGKFIFTTSYCIVNLLLLLKNY